jgi:hypothetical protein
MKIFGIIILLLFTFHSSAKAEKGVVVKILPDKLTLSIDCEAQTDLQAQQPFVFYTCQNPDSGMYFMEFRLNDKGLAAGFNRNSPNTVVNESQFKSYTLYEITAKDSNGKLQESAHYCTKELCLDLVGEFKKSVKDSITAQLQQ